MNEIRFIDLFSGIGGFRLGLERANHSRYEKDGGSKILQGNSPQPSSERLEGTTQGYRCVWSCDNNKYANQVYTKKFGEEGHYSANIRGVNPEEIPDFDLLCAGFPCQAFSVAGQRKGFQDTRGTLFFEICRIAEAKRPSLLLLENVKGLLNHDRGRTFTVILQTLDELGYWLEWQVLNSKYFGVPQNRERVFIVGHLRGTGRQEIFPITEPDELSSQESERGQRVASCLDSNYWKGTRRQRTFVTGMTLANLSRYKQGVNRTPAQSEGLSWALNSARDQGILKDAKIRRLTPTECERLQGFPDGWTAGISDTQRYKCLGNAVTVNVTQFLGNRILSLFTNKEGVR